MAKRNKSEPASPKDQTPLVEDTLMFSLILAGQTARMRTATILRDLNLTNGDDALLFALLTIPNASEFELADATGQLVKDIFPRLERLLATGLVEVNTLYALTEKGHSAIHAIREHWAALDKEFTKGMKLKKVKKLKRRLAHFSGL